MTKKLMLMASAALLVLAGCEKKVGGQVVAVVNGDEITQQDVNAELQGASIPPTADRKAITNQIIQRIVDRTLLVQKAKAEGLDKSPAYLEQIRHAQDAVAVNLLTSKAAKTVALPDTNAIDSFIASNPSLFAGRKVYRLDQIVFAKPSDETVVHKLEPAHTLDAIAAVLTASGIHFSRGSSQLDTGAIPPAVAAKIASLPPGEPFVAPDKGQFVASVIVGEQPNPTPAAQTRPAALNILRQQALGAAMQKQLESARAAAQIQYQPGYAPVKTPSATPAP